MDQFPADAYKKIFFPNYANAEERVRANGGKFIYYTNAATAVLILRNRQVWMRSTGTMNDRMEIRHGIECLEHALESKAGIKLAGALDQHTEGLFAKVRKLFEGWTPVFKEDTYITCVSEYDGKRFPNGRLSMWRAYGGDAGIALILNSEAMFGESDALAAATSPVAYLDKHDVEQHVERIADNITENLDYVKSLSTDQLLAVIFDVLRFAATCIKHKAFEEESEWRVVATPTYERSELVPVELEIVGGLPQTVLKIPLRDYPDKGLVGLEPASLIDKVLIGPCEYPEVVWHAIARALLNAGVANPYERLVNTNIPLRRNQR